MKSFVTLAESVELGMAKLSEISRGRLDVPCDQVFKRAIDYREAAKRGISWDTARPKMPGRVRPVFLQTLISTQQGLTTKNVRDIIEKHAWDSAGEPPVVVNVAGRLYLLDGHHRVAAAILAGERQIDAEVVVL